MKVVTARQMREIDRITIEERGTPGLELMERAGEAVTIEILDCFDPDCALVVTGKGNKERIVTFSMAIRRALFC